MTFKEYQHIERYGNDEVIGIELGECWIFPKLDGTNSSLWHVSSDPEGQRVHAGSRRRELSIDADNAGFLAAMREPAYTEKLAALFSEHPDLRLYGEWLVPHSLKTYRDNAWRRFWIFDVLNDSTDGYLTYEQYQPILERCGLDYIPPLAKIKNGSYENFIHVLNQNNFFIEDGKGLGEGIVLKNYNFYNKYGNQVWAKIVTSEFKEIHHKEMGCPENEQRLVEEQLADEFVTEALCSKTQAKIMNDKGGWTSKYIPELLGRVYHDVVTEEIWQMVNRKPQPTINFGTLRHFVIDRVKKQLPEVF